ncbi:MAG: hypothetical protein ACWA42_01490, partial [Lutibacter sp.]
MKYSFLMLLITLTFISCKKNKNTADAKSGATVLDNVVHYPQEKHLKNIKQLTFGGDNAEAYWSFDNTKLVFQ